MDFSSLWMIFLYKIWYQEVFIQFQLPANLTALRRSKCSTGLNSTSEPAAAPPTWEKNHSSAETKTLSLKRKRRPQHTHVLQGSSTQKELLKPDWSRNRADFSHSWLPANTAFWNRLMNEFMEGFYQKLHIFLILHASSFLFLFPLKSLKTWLEVFFSSTTLNISDWMSNN